MCGGTAPKALGRLGPGVEKKKKKKSISRGEKPLQKSAFKTLRTVQEKKSYVPVGGIDKTEKLNQLEGFRIYVYRYAGSSARTPWRMQR